jgi:putative SOS response-associated peptidase YedK
MCGRYVLVQKVEVIEQRFNVKADFIWKPNYNISVGNSAPIITSENPNTLQLFTFGMTPFWAKKPMYLFNARSEGDRNKSNDYNYKGGNEIISKPAFRKPIRSQRCLVVADAFVEGTTAEGLTKPYLVHLTNKVRPFAFAGIYDVWRNPQNGEELFSFSIITTFANELMRKIPHHRSPVILNRRDEAKWLNVNTPLSDITKLLKPYDSSLMNCYPISNRIKNPKENGAELISPIGTPMQTKADVKVSSSLKLQGMGSNKRNR